MFTILHRQSDFTERVFKAVEVEHRPAHEIENQVGHPPAPAAVHLLAAPDEGGPGVHVGTITSGTVFVMNDFGRTVATFHLDRPLGAPPA